MKKIVLILSIVFPLFYSGCEQDSEWADQENDEARRIEEYLAKNNLNASLTESGLYYVETKQGDGDFPVIGDFISFECTLKLIDGDVISTTDSSFAKEVSIYDSTMLYGPDKRQVGRLLQGINEAFTYMQENGTAIAIIPFKLGYQDNKDDKIPSYSTLVADLKLFEVIPDPEVHEQYMLDTFLNSHRDFIEIIEGLYYKKIKEGNDTVITSISIIDFDYSMYMLDGRRIRTNNTVEIMSNINLIGLQQGFQGLAEMEEGIFVIKSDLAYGDDENLSIPPYSSLMIKVKINEIR